MQNPEQCWEVNGRYCILSLSSQSEHVKNAIHWFGILIIHMHLNCIEAVGVVVGLVGANAKKTFLKFFCRRKINCAQQKEAKKYLATQ